MLQKEWTESYKELTDAEQRKDSLIVENNCLEEEYMGLKKNNEELLAEKQAMTIEFKWAKEELAGLVERAEN